MNTSAERLAELTLETIPLVMRTIRMLMRAEGEKELTLPQFRALGYIDRNRGASLSEVARYLGLSVPGTSRLIDDLVEHHLVSRTTDPTNRRQVTLNLLPDGEKQRAKARHVTQQGLAVILEQLRPADRAAVAKALPALQDIFAKASHLS